MKRNPPIKGIALMVVKVTQIIANKTNTLDTTSDRNIERIKERLKSQVENGATKVKQKRTYQSIRKWDTTRQRYKARFEAEKITPDRITEERRVTFSEEDTGTKKEKVKSDGHKDNFGRNQTPKRKILWTYDQNDMDTTSGECGMGQNGKDRNQVDY